jgi:TPP-dependent 2-oxoacid decarboxylase
MVERFVVNKAKDLYEAVGWDYQQLMNALEGKEAIEWV